LKEKIKENEENYYPKKLKNEKMKNLNNFLMLNM
jgi:hypothetical protein